MVAERFFHACAGIVCLALVAGTAGARTFKPGSAEARWSIKTTVPAGADLSHPRDVPIDKLTGLGNVPEVTARDSRFTNARIPTTMSGLQEGDIVRTKGWVHVVALEGDGDYHIQVTNSKSSGNHCLIVELPVDKVSFEKNAKLRARCAQLRPFLRDKLLHGTAVEFSESGNWMVGEVYMSITGQLFFDDWHVGGDPRGKQPGGHAGKASTLWEIHPVTDIQFAQKPH